MQQHVGRGREERLERQLGDLARGVVRLASNEDAACECRARLECPPFVGEERLDQWQDIHVLSLESSERGKLGKRNQGGEVVTCAILVGAFEDVDAVEERDCGAGEAVRTVCTGSNGVEARPRDAG